MSLRAGRLRAAVLIAIACALVAPASSASAASAKDSCKSGGYASYVDPATGQPFANQGQCVSSVNHGQTLVPVTPAHLPTPDVTLSLVDRDGTTYVQAHATDVVTFGWYEVTWVVDGVALNPDRIQVGEAGYFEVSYLPLPGQTVELLIDGVSVGSIVA